MNERSVRFKWFLPNPKPAKSKSSDALPWRKIFNAIFFQLGWFACVLGGDLFAVIALLVLLWCHVMFVKTQPGEWQLLAVVSLLGVGCDSLLSLSGLLIFDSQSLGLIPIWLACIWLLFATTLRHSLAWLQGRFLLAAALGAIAGPSSYYAGAQLAQVSFAQPQWSALLVMAMLWACLLPLQVWLSARFRPCQH